MGKKNEYKIKINEKPLNVSSDPGSYLSIDRKWKKGDKVTIQLPMHTTAEYLPDSSSWVSYVHGPIVLAAVTDSTDLGGIWADDTRMGHVAADKYYPLDEAPVIVAERGQDLSSGLKPVKGSPLTFTASGLIGPDKFQHLKLVPFFQVHEARYQIYWPVVQQEELEKRESALKEKEEKEAALEAKTVDQIATGEQQPEAEHNFKGEDTATGINKGMFWRDARGWFSYDLINKGNEGKVLRVFLFWRRFRSKI